MDPVTLVTVAVGGLVAGMLGVVGWGAWVTPRQLLKKARFDGLQPFDPGKSYRIFEHEGVECEVRVVEGAIVFSLYGLDVDLEGDSYSTITFVRGQEEWHGAARARLPEMLGFASVNAAAPKAGRRVKILVTANGDFRVLVTRGNPVGLALLGRALARFSAAQGLDRRVGLEPLQLPEAPDAANAPSGSSVGAPGLKR